MKSYALLCLAVILCPRVSFATPEADALALQIEIAKAKAASHSPAASHGVATRGPVSHNAPVVPCDAQSSVWAKETKPARVVEPPVKRTPPAVITNDMLGPDQQPTPMEGVTAALNSLNLQPEEPFWDLGCGHDARVLYTAARRGVKRCIGVEIDPEIADSARAYVAHHGLGNQIEIRTGDAANVNGKGGAAFTYLFPDTLATIRPQLATFNRVATYAHEVPGGVPGMQMRQIGDVYLYERPKPQLTVMNWRPAKPMALYGGKLYSGPVCNKRNCSMCNKIRSQLGFR